MGTDTGRTCGGCRKRPRRRWTGVPRTGGKCLSINALERRWLRVHLLRRAALVPMLAARAELAAAAQAAKGGAVADVGSVFGVEVVVEQACSGS